MPQLIKISESQSIVYAQTYEYKGHKETFSTSPSKCAWASPVNTNVGCPIVEAYGDKKVNAGLTY